MNSFFRLGPHVVPWQISALAANGPYRLTVDHPIAPIVEYYESAIVALTRMQEIEELLGPPADLPRAPMTARMGQAQQPVA